MFQAKMRNILSENSFQYKHYWKSLPLHFCSITDNYHVEFQTSAEILPVSNNYLPPPFLLEVASEHVFMCVSHLLLRIELFIAVK